MLGPLLDQILHCENSTVISKVLCAAVKIAPPVARALFSSMFEVTSVEVGKGNLAVFKEIVLTVTRFGAVFANVTDVQQGKVLLQKYIATLDVSRNTKPN